MERSRFFTWLLRVVCVAYWVMLTFGLLSPEGSAVLRLATWPLRFLQDTVHLAAFALLALLAWLARSPGRGWSLALALTAYALATELAQAFVPGREPDLRDTAYNLTGLALGALVGRMIESIGQWLGARKEPMNIEGRRI